MLSIGTTNKPSLLPRDIFPPCPLALGYPLLLVRAWWLPDLTPHLSHKALDLQV